MFVLFGDGTVGLLSFRKLRCNKQRQNGQYVVPNGIIHNHVHFSGDFIFAKAVNVLKDYIHLSVF